MWKSARFRVGWCRLAAQSLSTPLQSGICFFHTLIPAPPTAFLAVCLPQGAAIRAYRVPRE